MKSPGYLTTGQVAAAVGVAPRTASKWIDSGALPGWRVPGSQDRRVAVADLLAFCRRAGVPMQESFLAALPGVLVCSPDESLGIALAPFLPPPISVATATSLFAAGLAIPSAPRVVLLDTQLGVADCRVALDILRRRQRTVFVLACEDDTAEPWLALGASGSACRPIVAGELAARLLELLASPPPKPATYFCHKMPRSTRIPAPVTEGDAPCQP